MKRIVILCDGTWNRSDSRTPTNVVQLAQALEPVDGKGIVQVPIYVPGVGTGEGVNTFARWMDKRLGGAFGWGLLDNIVEAYRHLVFMYEPGDEVLVFGFSRGAYTARSLTGFIRSTGIIDRDKLEHLPDAVARYRTMDDERTHPGTEQSHQFRAGISDRVVTSEEEAEWRRQNKRGYERVLKIAYLGVWDSVGALGVPVQVPLLGRWTRRKYRFHDADLSSMVRAARHAVALDEQRRSFEPTRWTNVEKLNAASADPAARPYRELFFVGDHGSVGGGGDIRDLSSIALDWIIQGAQEAGLAVDPAAVKRIRAEQEPMGPLRNTREPPTGVVNWLMRLGPRYRKGPSSMAELHPTVLLRWSAEGKAEGFKPYRPGSLAAVRTEIAALHEARIHEAPGHDTHAGAGPASTGSA